jgi:hypothetical protein
MSAIEAVFEFISNRLRISIERILRLHLMRASYAYPCKGTLETTWHIMAIIFISLIIPFRVDANLHRSILAASASVI